MGGKRRPGASRDPAGSSDEAPSSEEDAGQQVKLPRLVGALNPDLPDTLEECVAAADTAKTAELGFLAIAATFVQYVQARDGRLITSKHDDVGMLSNLNERLATYAHASPEVFEMLSGHGYRRMMIGTGDESRRHEGFERWPDVSIDTLVTQAGQHADRMLTRYEELKNKIKSL